jgi:CheY-like chemotaxis protein
VSTQGTVLVIDDDRDVCEAVAAALATDAWSTVIACSAEEALAAFDGGARPDMILCDVVMPGIDGWHFLSARLRNPDLVEVPVVLMSARLEEQDSSRQVGAPFLPKPLDLDTLFACVEHWRNVYRGH